jgi:hypothetical protein
LLISSATIFIIQLGIISKIGFAPSSQSLPTAAKACATLLHYLEL